MLTVPSEFCSSKANDGFLKMDSQNSQPKGLSLCDKHLFWKSLGLELIKTLPFVLALKQLWVLLDQIESNCHFATISK